MKPACNYCLYKGRDDDYCDPAQCMATMMGAQYCPNLSFSSIDYKRDFYQRHTDISVTILDTAWANHWSSPALLLDTILKQLLKEDEQNEQ